jgi:hypothetical protein
MTKPITPEEHDRYLKELRLAREQDIANGWDPDAVEEGDAIDPEADVVAVFAKKGKK